MKKIEMNDYEMTKRGCEFLAHKTTGTKGNLFKDRYMDKFNSTPHEVNGEIKLLGGTNN
ncbi:Rha family transcriptional regulator [Clostridium sp.]|uniref:Rha family transcriptional regulator n=1 Tax=Clostridium sp. TaxID=1506 RepID=UPI002840503F|nr:Rha family transcriptional regulator [Clostridium sp.]MDR3593382.1 Rha family transcriptional regulator [Clostridium sp.]